ncbi:MAG: nickel pincer cofactor biosynthesis protein LarC [Eubacteriales bacterium]|nr:nickel pincer cofactor biosynthesis protein LarC [Eubacteriales bacterium]
MKILYLDCGMGAAGDMLTAALTELLPDPDDFIRELNALGIPGVHVERQPSVKCGITGTHISVMVNGEEEESLDYPGHDHAHHHHHHHHHDADHHHEHEHEHHHEHTHSHRSLHDVEHIVRDHLPVSEQVKEDVMAVYGLIAEAESHVHGVPVQEIHFHEVGTIDAIADITAVCILMEKLAPDEVVASPVHVGSGQVRCAHGILPVPAPATAYLLRNIPAYGGSIRGELCTPTGAALLRHFVSRFESMPVMRVQAIGYGMGKKDFEAANCVRAMLGEAEGKTDAVLELSCNVDDMTAEQMGFAMERLMEGGALDVYTIPIGMKKSRPGMLLRVLLREQDRENILKLVFRHTTTLGVRENRMQRHILERSITTLETPYGPVRRKDSRGYGVTRSKYEYEDLARVAAEQHISLEETSKRMDQYLKKD